MPEYRGRYKGENAALFTHKDRRNTWKADVVLISEGIMQLENSFLVAQGLTEQQVLNLATSRGMEIKDTWPPRNPSIGFYLGQLRSYISFGKWR